MPSGLIRLLKRELEISVSNEMSPLWSFCNHPFHKNVICPKGITYNTCPDAPGGFVDPGVCYLIFELCLTKWPSQNFHRIYWEEKCVMGLVALQSLLSLEKGTRNFDFQLNEPLQTLHDHPFHVKCVYIN